MDLALAGTNETVTSITNAATDVIQQNAKLASLTTLGIWMSVVILLAFIGFGFLFLMSWEKDKVRNEQREKALVDFMTNQQQQTLRLVGEHDTRAQEFMKSLREVNDYQRAEHKEMIEILIGIKKAVEGCLIKGG